MGMYKNVKGLIRLAPSLLLDFKSSHPELYSYADSVLPYETGIEIECALNDDNRGVPLFMNIENIIDFSSIGCEQRFRIPSGVKGMIVLYNICQILKQEAGLNPDSGIHYHIDCRDVENWHRFANNAEYRWGRKWILPALKSWGYTGKANRWEVTEGKTAVKIHEGKRTVEIRIGEMTFDYSLILKRIIHSQNIVRKMKRMQIAFNKRYSGK